MKQTKAIELLDDRQHLLQNKTYTSYCKQTYCKVKMTFLSSGGATHYNKYKYKRKKMKPESRKYERSSKLFEVLIYT